MMMAAIRPAPASLMAHLLEKAHVAPNEWPTIDLHQREALKSRVRGAPFSGVALQQCRVLIFSACLACGKLKSAFLCGDGEDADSWHNTSSVAPMSPSDPKRTGRVGAVRRASCVIKQERRSV
jgi:hypothetical protein